MLIEFTIDNYRCYRTSTTLSFMTTKLDGPHINVATLNLSSKSVSINKSAAIYGANASGKSTFVKAFELFKLIIINSMKIEDDEEFNVSPFALTEKDQKRDTSFEAVFVNESTMYRYGFSLNAEKITSEWMYYTKKTRESLIFSREGDDYDFGRKFRSSRLATKLVNKKSLFISVASSTGQEFGKTVTSFVKSIVPYDPCSQDSTINVIGDFVRGDALDILQDAMRFADLGIEKLTREEATPEEAVELVRNNKVRQKGNEEVPTTLIEDILKGDCVLYQMKYYHKMHPDADNNSGLHPFHQDDESVGTIKFVALMSLAIRAFLRGGLIVVDEFDTSLHPLLANAFIRFFHAICQNQAQLIITTHNALLLQNDIFRRDQLWIAEKNQRGEASIKSISDFKPRKDASLEKLYLSGMFGGVPYLHDGYMDRLATRVNELLSIQNDSTVDGGSDHAC